MSVSAMIFVAAFFAALGVAITRHPYFGLYAYLGAFYLHPPSRWWAASLPDLRWSYLAAFTTLIAMWIHRKPQSTRPSWLETTPARIMILFCIWFWISTLWALDKEVHIPAAVMLSKYLLIYYMVYTLLDSTSKIERFLFVHVAGCAYLGWVALSAFSGGRLDGVGGPGIDDSSTLGMQMGTGAIAAGMLMLRYNGWRWLCIASAGALCLNTLVLTSSRGAFLGVLAGGVVVAVLRPADHARQFRIYAVLGVVALSALATGAFWDRMMTITTATSTNVEEVDISSQSRIEMFKAQLKMSRAYPLGTGHRGSEVLSKDYLATEFLYAGRSRSSHNAEMTVLVEQGIPGFVLMIALIAWVVRVLRTIKREEHSQSLASKRVLAGIVGGSLAVVLVSGFFADLAKCEVQIWMFAILAALAALQEIKDPVALKALQAQ
jgi:O-antigen ligase